LGALALEIAGIRGVVDTPPGDRVYASLDPVLLPGATVVHVGAGAPAFLKYALKRVGETGSVAALGVETALDALFAEVVVDVLRIDAPGLEPGVLRGARRSLARHASTLIMLHFDRSSLRRVGMSTEMWLRSMAETGLEGGLFHAEGAAMRHATVDSLEEVESCELLFSRLRP